MQEEVNDKTIALSVKTAKLTGTVLKVALQKFLSEMEKQKQKGKAKAAQPKQGKQTMKQLSNNCVRRTEHGSDRNLYKRSDSGCLLELVPEHHKCDPRVVYTDHEQRIPPYDQRKESRFYTQAVGIIYADRICRLRVVLYPFGFHHACCRR